MRSSASSSTSPDEIPAVHVLEAAQSQDRKETEDLLAGFDRPGRGPKRPSSERDFVDYYTKKKGGPESGGGRAVPPSSSAPPAVMGTRDRDEATVVKPRRRRAVAMPPWLGWAGVALGMLGIGGVVAYLATGDARPGAVVPSNPGAATTITAATRPGPTSTENIPLPAPVDPTTTTTTPIVVAEPAPVAAEPTPRAAAPPAAARRDPRAPAGGAAATTNATGGATGVPRGSVDPRANEDRKPPPRDDFIRDL